MINKISFAIFFTAALALVGCSNEVNESWHAQIQAANCPCPMKENCPCTKGDKGPCPMKHPCPCRMMKQEQSDPRLLSTMISGATRDLMDQSDEKLARDAALRALEGSPVGGSQYWMNPNTDNRGESKVVSVTDNGRCRVLFSNVIDSTDMEFGSETVTYCKSSDKSWSGK